MTQVTFRATVNSKGFPFLSEGQGRTVVVPGLDLVKAKSSISGDVDGNLATPEIYYCHNVIATAEGYQSVSYRQLATPPSGTDNLFTYVVVIRDGSGNKAYLGVTSSGRCYILRYYLSGWLRTTDIGPASLVTTAYVNGVTYIYFSGIGCYVYNFSTNVLGVQALTGLVAADMTGVFESNGYLCVFSITNRAVYWSSLVTPVDFTPSIITGAGGGAVQGLRGNMVTAKSSKFGFIVYTEYNVVVGVYTGNVRYPFSMKGVTGSGGTINHRYIDEDPTSGDHYAWTTSGLQLISNNNAVVVFPALTDFISGSRFEDFNETTREFTQTTLSAPMVKKVTTVADRYLIVSYGITSLTHAIIYDTALNRMGKLKIDHVDCFDYLLLSADTLDSPRNCVAFLQNTGAIYVASFTKNISYGAGVLILGKYQVIRSMYCSLLEVDIENVRDDVNFTCYDMYSLDGKNTSLVAGYLYSASGLLRKYKFRQPGINHSLVFMGPFEINSVVMEMQLSGSVKP